MTEKDGTKGPRSPQEPGAPSGLMERLAAMLGLKPGQAHLIRMLAVALALGILFLNAGELFGVMEPKAPPAGATQVSTGAEQPVHELSRLERQMARELEEKLSLIQGAGRVRVAVTLEATPAAVPVINTREQKTQQSEQATDGSTRKTDTIQVDQNNVVTRDGNRDSLAILRQDRAPIAGVLIVAEGADSPGVRAALHAAAVAALGAPAHRVSVVPAERRSLP